MKNVVYLSNQAQKDISKIPEYILFQFDLWIEIIEEEGFLALKSYKGYRDHALKGSRKGQRSTSLSRSWRVIYILDTEKDYFTVNVLEVNHHEYKK